MARKMRMISSSSPPQALVVGFCSHVCAAAPIVAHRLDVGLAYTSGRWFKSDANRVLPERCNEERKYNIMLTELPSMFALHCVLVASL